MVLPSGAHVSHLGLKPLLGSGWGPAAQGMVPLTRAHSTHGDRGYDTAVLFRSRSGALPTPEQVRQDQDRPPCWKERPESHSQRALYTCAEQLEEVAVSMSSSICWTPNMSQWSHLSYRQVSSQLPPAGLVMALCDCCATPEPRWLLESM